MKIHTDIKSGATWYTVKPGDNLSTIALHFYGNESATSVNKIYNSNRKTIGPNPNLIQPGQKLLIPDYFY